MRWHQYDRLLELISTAYRSWLQVAGVRRLTLKGAWSSDLRAIVGDLSSQCVLRLL